MGVINKFLMRVLRVKYQLPFFSCANTHDDRPTWNPCANGKISIKSSYLSFINTDLNTPFNEFWNKISFLKIPQKLKCFIWLALIGKLLTNTHRLVRGITDNADCDFCAHFEDINHVVRTRE